MNSQFGGYPSDDEDEPQAFNPLGNGGAGGYLASMMAGLGGPSQGGAGWGGGRFGPNSRTYDEYFKAYSVAMLPGRQRDNLTYGGKSTSALSSRATIVH